MDPFSADGELVTIHNAFHQGQYQSVVDFDTSTLSESNILSARILKLRARIQIGQSSVVMSEIQGEAGSNTDLAAVLVLAQHATKPSDEAVVTRAAQLAKEHGENLSVELLCGTVLANAGRREEALALLAKHQGSLDAVALLVQIQLSQNRLDLAQQEVRRARSWAQDNLLVNIAEAWVGLREGGEKYQSAFYVFEELATAPSTSSSRSMLAQAVSELHLGRLPEAEAAMNSALQAAPKDPDVLANAIVLHTILGKTNDASDVREQLEGVDSSHEMVVESKRRREAFDTARVKWSPKFEIET
ncbi:MAG: hypothetical protein M1828_005750 [Chrysothrix sp. TS-e1954]|nr:MAG: hypothetical protein M1828_005750 [Chrysothrix sp. TS-e1954]